MSEPTGGSPAESAGAAADDTTTDGSAAGSAATDRAGKAVGTVPDTDRPEGTGRTDETYGTDGTGRTDEGALTAFRGARVRAEGLGCTGPRGVVFENVRFDAAAGSLVAVEGASGSGRTCLLLALTGRMRTTSGHAYVDGHRLPGKRAAVRGISALGAVPGVTDLEPALSVAEQIREQVLLRRRFSGPLGALLRPRRERAAARARLTAALSAAGLDPERLPKGLRTRVRDLDRLESLRLSVALALLAEPRLLAVDDVDLKLTGAEREEAWSLLGSLAHRGLTVLAVCSEAPEGALVVRTRTGGSGTSHTGTGTGDGSTAKGEADAFAEAGRA